MIDASHDNSGKDPEKQFFAAGEIADQVADGNKAIVGVMLESFLVEGRQDLVPGEELTYGQSITDACIDWDDTVAVLERFAVGGRGARAVDEGRLTRVAVLGVGLIGGSIGLAARRRLEAEVVGYEPRPGDRSSGRSSWARSTAPPARSPRPARAPRSSSAPAPVAALPELAREALAASGPGDRRHRRRLDQARAGRGARRRRALHRRPPAGRGRDRRASRTPAPTSSRAPAGT